MLHWLGGLALIAAGIWSIELVRRQDPFARFNQAFAEAGMGSVGVRLLDVEAVLRQGATQVARLRADRVDFHRNRIYWWVYGVREGVLYEKGKPFARVAANYLEYNTPAKKLLISGNLRCTLQRPGWLSGKPVNVHLASLTWDIRHQRLESLGPVQLAWDNGSASAQRMVANVAERALRLERVEILFTQQEGTKEQKKMRKIPFRAASSYYKDGVWNAKVIEMIDGDTVMRANQAIYNEEIEHLTATGGLKLFDPQAEITGQKLEVWRKEKRALLIGSVQLLIKPKQEEEQKPANEAQKAADNPQPEKEDTSLKAQRRYPVRVTCDQIEYFYKKKIAILTGNLKAVQVLKEDKTRVLTAERAEYDQKKEILTLTGNVVLDDEKGNHVEARKVVASTKEGEEWFEAEDLTGGWVVEEEEEEQTPPSPEQKPTETKPPKPGSNP